MMSNVFLFSMPSGMEFVFIILIILLLFGGKKIPELMKGLGKGVKSFKQGVAEAESEIKKAQEDIEKPIEKDSKTEV